MSRGSPGPNVPRNCEAQPSAAAFAVPAVSWATWWTAFSVGMPGSAAPVARWSGRSRAGEAAKLSGWSREAIYLGGSFELPDHRSAPIMAAAAASGPVVFTNA
jgi:hypothetical protein